MAKTTKKQLASWLSDNNIVIKDKTTLCYADGTSAPLEQLMSQFPTDTYINLQQLISDLYIAQQSEPTEYDNIAVTKLYMAKLGYYIDFGVLYRREATTDQKVSLSEVITMLANEGSTAGRMGAKYDTKINFQIALEAMICQNKTDTWRLLVSSSAYDQSLNVKNPSSGLSWSDDYLRVWHEAFMIEQPLDVFAAMVRHHMWLIKRRMRQLPTKMDIFLNWKGNSGIGKGFAIFHGIYKGILGKYATEVTSLEEVLDSRAANILSNYLINIDELGTDNGTGSSRYQDKRSMSKFKSLITSTVTPSRPLYSNNIVDNPVNCVWMATANLAISDVFNDTTGMRRFFEIVSNVPQNIWADKERVAYLIANASTFFRSVDEQDVHGYYGPHLKGLYATVCAIQNSYIAETSDVKYAKDHLVVGGPATQASIVYTRYKTWCDANGRKPVGSDRFYKSIKDIYKGAHSIGAHKMSFYSLQEVL